MEEAIASRDAAIQRRNLEIRARADETAGLRLEVEQLEAVATRLSERVVERERELEEVRAELERARGEGDEAVRALGALGDELERVREQARGQATRIRLRALRDAAELSDRIAELAKRPAEARERLLEAVGQAIERLGGEAEADSAPASANGHDPDAEAEDIFAGLVEVDVGPLSDFAQLVGFEDAANGIGATAEISVKRFARGRATLELQLREPVELLRELEERAPFEFQVRDTRDGRVVLDVESTD